MSAAADKARYFLEQSVPELKELEKKKLFSSQEITSIVKKRSDFEHKINARGSSPTDYAQCAEFEINVDTLRRKRMKRLGVRSTTHNGQRRIFFVFDRGNRKFPGDVDLWMQTIQYARRQKAYKKLAQIFTSVLRLHPTKSELWIYAAQFAVEDQGDMTEARSYMQRGLRFCKSSRDMWIEYIRLEMAYMAKIHARRRILGIGNPHSDVEPAEVQAETDDLLSLPKVTMEDIMPDSGKGHDIDEAALRDLDNTPAMTGAIPIAIIDAAFKQFSYDAVFAHQCFDAVAEFESVPVSERILNHILDSLRTHSSNSWHTHACLIAMELVNQHMDDVAFPRALRACLSQMTDGLSRCVERKQLAEWCKGWLRAKKEDGMDHALEAVLNSKILSLDQQ